MRLQCTACRQCITARVLPRVYAHMFVRMHVPVAQFLVRVADLGGLTRADESAGYARGPPSAPPKGGSRAAGLRLHPHACCQWAASLACLLGRFTEFARMPAGPIAELRSGPGFFRSAEQSRSGGQTGVTRQYLPVHGPGGERRAADARGGLAARAIRVLRVVRRPRFRIRVGPRVGPGAPMTRRVLAPESPRRRGGDLVMVRPHYGRVDGLT
jgi:hypothetical protein